MRKLMVLIWAVVLTIPLLGAARAELLREKFDSCDTNYVFVIAHRADWRHHPENAMTSAIALETNRFG